MRQRLIIIGLALGVLTVPVRANTTDMQVMTRNLYLGADLAPLLAAETPEEFAAAIDGALGQVALNDFPERADALAHEIADTQPHLVSLQEVSQFTLNGVTGPAPFRDYLTDLLEALAAAGAHYHAAATSYNLDVTIPLPDGSFVGVLDRDVVLARDDVAASPVQLLGCAKPTGDGCGYQVVLSFDTPLGVPISVERGFVVVDAMVEGQPARFVNTHLEDSALPRIFQTLQATELVGLLTNPANATSAPVIVAGDFNSSPEDEPFTFEGTVYPSAYQILTASGLIDSWTLRPGTPPGYTCCQESDLRNNQSVLNSRVDLIFSNLMPAAVKANLVGDDPSDETKPLHLWPSDHAGVFARLRFGN